MKRYLHAKSGTYYKLLCITNENATDKNLWPVTAVYTDGINKWSRPLEEFNSKFTKVDIPWYKVLYLKFKNNKLLH